MKNIATAFVKAKKAFSPALKDSTNPHFKSKYADLATCLEAVNDALLDNGIALYQETHEDASGVTVETVLLHETGESIRSGKLHVPAAKQDPQGYGSALTYARRYSLMAACGIAPEDDDGNAAVSGKQRQDAAPPAQDMRPVARAGRLTQGVEDGDAKGAAIAIAGWDGDLREAVWKLLDEKTREILSANWPAA